MILLKTMQGGEGGGSGTAMSMAGFEELMEGMKEEMWTKFTR